MGLRWLTMMALELDWEIGWGRADVERTSCAWSGGRLPWLGDRSIDSVELECRSRSRQQLSLSDGECSIVIDSMMTTTGSISRRTNGTLLFCLLVCLCRSAMGVSSLTIEHFLSADASRNISRYDSLSLSLSLSLNVP